MLMYAADLHRRLSTCILLALVTTCWTVVGSGALSADDPPSTADAEANQSIQAEPRALSRAFRLAARKATPSVVTILSYGQEEVLGRRQQDAAPDRDADDGNSTDESTDTGSERTVQNDKILTGLGSGVIVSADGIVVTNHHVVKGAKRVVVQLADETEFEASQVRGDRASDIATLRISREEPFPAADLGDSDSLEIGDWVLAIGSPFRLEATVSAGIISAKNRKLESIERSRMIQTDAAINPGNSGGPLIDLDGRVVAINTAIATRTAGYQGVGFAIPINQAEWIARELDQHGRVRRAAIGITMVELKPRIAAKFNLPAWKGVLAYQVIKDSAGDRAGVKQLDVILEFAGEPVRDPNTLREVIERLPVGSTQQMKVLRDGQEIVLSIELASVTDPTLDTDAPNPGASTGER